MAAFGGVIDSPCIFNDFYCFLDVFFDLSGPRGGLEGILELLDATEELLYPLKRHLRRYHSALGAILGALEGYKMAQRGEYDLQLSNRAAATACGEGGGRG